MAASRTQTPSPPSAPLFEPQAGEKPPYAAVELYVEAPASVGIFHTAAAQEGKTEYLAAIEAAREAGVAEVLECVYENALLKVGYHAAQRHSGWTVGVYEPGQLFLTRVAHLVANDHTDVARLHDHIYLGECGVASDGQRWPVDLYSTRRAITSMYPRYHFALERSLTKSLGVEWNIPEGSGTVRQLVMPPLAQYVADYPRVICNDQARVAQRWNVQDIAHPPRFDPEAVSPGDNPEDRSSDRASGRTS
jgi:hypothetical protein